MAYSFSWPGTLPQYFLLEPYSETDGLQISAWPMDSGAVRTQFEGYGADVLQLGCDMSAAQVEIFRGFVRNTLRGTSRFGLPHPRTGEIVEARIKPNGEGKPFGLSAINADTYRVSFEVWVLP